jgi:hypothetical protein
MFPSSGRSSEFKHAEPGTVNAVLVELIDLGTQVDKMGKKSRKVRLGWEIDQRMDDGRPFKVYSTFNNNINPIAALGGFLENWRGVAFTEDQLKNFDLSKLLGQTCLLTLVREGDFTNVKAATKLPKGMAALEPEGSYTLFHLDNFSQTAFDSLSEKLREKIKLSPEYAKAMDLQVGATGSAAPDPDIPF